MLPFPPTVMRQRTPPFGGAATDHPAQVAAPDSDYNKELPRRRCCRRAGRDNDAVTQARARAADTVAFVGRHRLEVPLLDAIRQADNRHNAPAR